MYTPQEQTVVRMIQESVPGKQVTLAHLIANPDETLCKKMGVKKREARDGLAIFTITPAEASIIAADAAVESGDVDIALVDRFSGSLVLTGELSALQASTECVLRVLCEQMGFARPEITLT